MPSTRRSLVLAGLIGIAVLWCVTGRARSTEDLSPTTAQSAPRDSSGATADSAQADSTIAGPAEGLAVIYFHQAGDCSDCALIERYIRDILELDFGDWLASGRIRFASLALEAGTVRAMTRRYGVAETSLVLSRREGGRETTWIVLPALLELVGDRLTLDDLVRGEIGALLAE